jgi:hypothetical protein
MLKSGCCIPALTQVHAQHGHSWNISTKNLLEIFHGDFFMKKKQNWGVRLRKI